MRLNKMTTRNQKIKTTKDFAFIDASNLFYGGEKSLGWKVDYQKLIKYLKDKYGITKVFYFGGVELHTFQYDYLKNDGVQVEKLERYLTNIAKNASKRMNEAQLALLARHIQRVRFYAKLGSFGYELLLKPVKSYEQDDGTFRRKANCDVEMAFYLMKEKDNFDRALILSGDGDFLPVLKYLREQGKDVIILARGPRTAREIRQFAGSNFRDFTRLETILKFDEKL